MNAYQSLVKLTQDNPKAAKTKVEEWLSAHPDDAAAANLLAYILLQLRQLKKAEKLIEENYRKFPTHLMIRINYADLCLRNKRLNEIPRIFPSFDLQELYPEQKKFLSAHVRAFAVLMGFYHIRMGSRPAAEQFYIQAVDADPLHPSVALLEKKLFRFQRFKKFLSKIGCSC